MSVNTDQRIKRLLKDIPKDKQEQATELALNAIAIEDKLADTREKIWYMDIVIPYDNGGGQMGLRENPAYKAYTSLLSSYQRTISELSNMKEETTKARSFFEWNK